MAFDDSSAPIYTRPSHDPMGSRRTLKTAGGDVDYFDITSLGDVSRLPYSMRVLLEACLRNVDDFEVTEANVRSVLDWTPAGDGKAASEEELPFKPARVILQDFTGVPCVVDLAAMRSAMKKAGGDPQKINPLVPVDLVIDHSVQVDEYASPLALFNNVKVEFERNLERYEFLKWGQKAFRNFGVVPPSIGIVHQVNLEYLAKVVMTSRRGIRAVAMPDSLVGTDSHTTMINGLGVLGWGVGGIEAEAAMLGQPCYLLMPEVVGMKLEGELPEGATATDLVLTVTQVLRSHGVVGKFVEFYGEGMKTMSVADRATIANMAPEYGATMGFFPVDEKTLEYLRLTGRESEQVDLVERYCKANALWCDGEKGGGGAGEPTFGEKLQLDLSTIVPSVAGPRRPQDRIDLRAVRPVFRSVLMDDFGKSLGTRVPAKSTSTVASAEDAVDQGLIESFPASDVSAERPGDTQKPASDDGRLHHGDVVIAAITSCTNTSNPSVMVAAGLVAKKANALGLKVPPYVKTSLAPGSRVVTDYLDKADLSKELDTLGFHTVGYGCTTCIGNSGPLPERIAREVEQSDLVVCSVLSGNRNFEGRINPHVKANYLASPPLVVAYALAGSMDVNLMDEPITTSADGEDVYLKDIWPTQQEVAETVASCIEPGMFRSRYGHVAEGNDEWNAIPVKGGELFAWDEASTYIQEPPFFDDLQGGAKDILPVREAKVLVMVGDSVTTDHISPAGAIKKDSPAGRFLTEHGVAVGEFNSYGARRGNDRVMTRGTFANIRLKNNLARQSDGSIREGGYTSCPPGGEVTTIYDAARTYKAQGTPLVVLAGKDYGMGSSRDWAAKGTNLLGVKVVIAESYERIHRSNLVGMGVLPLTYAPGQSAASLGLEGTETFDVDIPPNLKARQPIAVRATKADGKVIEFQTRCRADTPVEVEYYRNGGILQTVLRKLLQGTSPSA